MKLHISEKEMAEHIRDTWHENIPPLSFYTFMKYEQAPESYVYFIQCGDFIKIGCSATPEERVDQLRRGGKAERPTVWEGNPYLLGYFPGGLREESEQHKRWSHLRDRGEWFKAEEELVAFAKEIRSQQAAVEVMIHEEERQEQIRSQGIDLTPVDLEAITQKHLSQPLTTKELSA